jgi:phospholipid-translocating ATPase
LRGRGRSNASDTTNVDGAKEVNVELGRAELDRLRTQTNAASESKEAARRQERQDHISSRKERQPRSWKNWTGYTTDSTAKKVVKKERRTVYINIEGGGATNPKGYERNKVRTSKYTLVTFLPKVCFPFSLSFQFCDPTR